MSSYGRRHFLSTAAKAGLAVLSFLYLDVVPSGKVAHASDAQLTEPEPLKGPDPDFFGGRVVEKSPNGVVLEAQGEMRAIRIPAGTLVWKEFHGAPERIEIGDWVDVRGTSLEDGTLLARSEWVWANIGRREGIVETVGARDVTLKTKHGAESLELSDRLEVITAKDNLPVPEHVGALKVGTHVGAVGLILPNKGFRATRIWMQ